MASKKLSGRKVPRWLRTIPGLTVFSILMVTAGFVGAAGFSILTQTVPTGTAPSVGFSATCTALAMETNKSGANTTNAEVAYNCTNLPAIKVATAGVHTPTFTLPAAFTDAKLIPASTKGIAVTNATTASCTTYTGAISLTTLTSVSLSTGSYNYCFDSSSPGGAITSFTISWS